MAYNRFASDNREWLMDYKRELNAAEQMADHTPQLAKLKAQCLHDTLMRYPKATEYNTLLDRKRERYNEIRGSLYIKPKDTMATLVNYDNPDNPWTKEGAPTDGRVAERDRKFQQVDPRSLPEDSKLREHFEMEEKKRLYSKK